MASFNIIKGQNLKLKNNFELIQVFPYLGLDDERDLQSNSKNKKSYQASGIFKFLKKNSDGSTPEIALY